ncbi:MAG: septal ring lytic transglycosylase RlpA family protein [Xanthomonadales bacterium]|nr:septal ring lytic transglycosylase RlpA family protein [Gammaproteobacteria bacterium]MBT8054206.1 septal ring lytic transglycosylase RlpA family protein [Gammaproteobacteria bacterium]NND57601.1 septal ring lytic transglycosylase RlpA family protein [Xanthomonadales bacterium]NNK51325.1 septal ring lytic transglycosylase RlpA family protein [Xanthomonadales bacterium]
MIPLRYTGLALSLVAGVLLLSCSGERARDDELVDGPSLADIKAADVADAVPKDEPLARYGNHSPYEVFGKKYTVLRSSEGYHEQGIASWYGSKFHGRRTSSGEPYDMHLATAAHKSLPLPTYAEVTNLDNGKKVIVKINDRGPFKHGRLIDMSYGAALRLGMTGTGTARVDVRVIDVDQEAPALAYAETGAVVDSNGTGTWLQAGAYGDRDGAERLAGQLKRASLNPVSIHDAGDLFRVWLGPYKSQAEIESVISRVIELGFERPHKVRR